MEALTTDQVDVIPIWQGCFHLDTKRQQQDWQMITPYCHVTVTSGCTINAKENAEGFKMADGSGLRTRLTITDN